MSFFNTDNPIPSKDPRDLDDNAMHIDEMVNSTAPTFTDRKGATKKTLVGIQQSVDAIISPNVSSLSELTLSADKGLYSDGSESLALFDLTPLARNLNAAADVAEQALALPWVAPKVSPALTGTPTSTTPAVGTDTTQIATAAMIQAEIAHKRPWASFTPTVTSRTGSFTSASATGSYMVSFGVCHFKIRIIITTKGSGAYARATLPVAALAGWDAYVFLAREATSGQHGSAVINATLNGVECTSNSGDLVASDGSTIYLNGSYPVA